MATNAANPITDVVQPPTMMLAAGTNEVVVTISDIGPYDAFEVERYRATMQPYDRWDMGSDDHLPSWALAYPNGNAAFCIC